jgi:hypothetical protein
MSASGSAPLFVATSALKLKSWPGEESIAVFSPNQVQTHLIDELAAYVLRQAAATPVSLENLQRQLLAEQGLDDQEGDAAEVAQAMQATVQGLLQAGLLRSV